MSDKIEKTGDASSTEFLRKNATFSEDGTSADLSKSGYYEFMEKHHSLTKQTINSVVAGEKDLVQGAVDIAAELLENKIAEAKAKGEDASDVRVSVDIGRPFGTLSISGQSEYTVRDIKTKETSIRYGRIGIHNKAKVLTNKDQLKAVSERITKLMSE